MDTITNSSEINGLSKSHATTDSIVGELGTLGAAILEASSNPTARFTGIEGGAGADTIRNKGQIDFTAQSTADVLGVGAGVGLLGFIKGDVSTTAKAFATGIHGDLIPDDDGNLVAGNDDITNTGSIITLAHVTANGRSIAGQLSGVAMADGTTTGEATAEGISGDGAQDTITNTGLFDITATSNVTGWAVSGELLGWSDTDLTTTATSHATGIKGGDDDDTINNTLPETNGESPAVDGTQGTITVYAEATANGNVISGNLAGVTSGEAGTTSNAIAKGVSGGAGADTINNKATIDVTATSSANGLGVAAGLLGWEQVDLTTTSNASATGIDGGDSGDTITNGVIGDTEGSQGNIHVLAEAISDGKSISVALSGFTDADQALPGDATATGIIGDAGTDEIFNYGLIDVTATAASKPASLSIVIFGYAKANAIAGPEATTTGIDGGDGDDTITNAGTIRAGYVPEGSLAMATVSKTEGELKVTTAGTGGGYAMAEAALGTLATATGIFGGGGIDTIENTGTIEVGSGGEGASPMAKTTSKGLSVGILGGAKVKSVVTAHAESTGIDGGDGDDIITNCSMGTDTGIITVNATSDAYVDDAAGSGFLSIQGADITATSQAVGMAGGNGSDTINNNNSEDGFARGTITVNAMSVARNDGNSDSGFLISTSKASTQVNVSAKGIQADADDEAADPDLENNTVVNNGDITVQAMATGYASSDAYVFAGRAGAKGTAGATVDASGIDAGIGLNSITNNGSISASAIAMVRPYAKANTDIDTNIAEAYGNSQASAFGISAGDGGNTVTNTEKGTIIAMAEAKTYDAQGYKVEARSDEESIAVAGWDSEAEEYQPVTSDAAGILLGDGSDIVINDGIITVTSTTDAKAYAYSNSWPNYAQSDAKTAGESNAKGITAGDGDNWIVNNGQILVGAWGNADPIADSFSRDDTSSTTAFADATATAIAMEASGNLLNASSGIIEVKARATTHAQTGSNDPASEETTATADLTARATGIGTASDAICAEPDHIRNDGSITVTVLAGEDDNGDPEYIADATVDTKTTRNRAEARGASTVDAAGIRAGNNSAEITNTGDLNVLGRACAHLLANSDEDSDAVTGVDEDTAVIAEATGIQSGDGDNTITNPGSITVTSEVTTHSNGIASSKVFTATATSKAGASTDATGIMVGEGDNTIKNYGTLTVTAANTGTALSDYPSAHLDKAFAYAGAVDTTLTSEATGISVGEGVNVIENHNSIIVSSTVDAEAYAYANTTTTTTTAEAHAGGHAKATGIFAGNGQNILKNYGDMTVSATADAYAKGDADEYGYACIGYESIGSGSVPGIIAQAIGISVGHGINEIINYGTLEVNSTATANSIAVGDEATIAIANSYAAATGIHTGDGMNIVSNVGTINVAADGKDASAIGIQTGDGDDTIANYGTINATNIKNSTSSLGLGITSGGGNDRLFLMNGSETDGHINLCEGDDRIILSGTPLVAGEVTGAAGIDTLMFDGPGSIDFIPMAFENAVKQGAGTYSASGLPTMQRIEVNQGTLQIDSSYAMADDSSFRTYINGDGSHGQLNVNGKAQLNGELNMVKGPGVFRNGTLYDIILADEVEGIFSSETLPEDKPLLSFQTHTYSERVEMEALSKSFTTVAANSLQWTIAQHLDGVMPNATGDLSLVLGEFQALSEPEFNEAFAGLSPDTYNNSTRTTINSTQQSVKTIQQRMHSLRGSLKFSAADTRPGYGVWLHGLVQQGDQDGEDGYTGYDYDLYGGTLGADRLLNDHMLIGISLGAWRADIDFENNMGDSDVDAFVGSLYGSWFTERYYLDASLSYGYQEYDNTRNITIGAIERTATSDHDGNIFSGYLEGGYNYSFGRWMLGPFGTLNYLYLDEDGFTESGAGSLNLSVDDRQTEAMFSQLGAVVAGRLTYENFELMPELRLAWKHDFDIDDQVVTSVFVGAPGVKFSIDGQDIERNSLMVEVGATLLHKNGLSVPIKYAAELRNGYTAHGVLGLIRYEF
ncbi:MAG: autotransporter domain-containing protein [Thermodesulfobacteriota bacterium]|nr:autotransporter domain-containing protein [Thermodesulfobacteriota bacterium]